MLILKAAIGQTIRLFDESGREEIGQIVRLKPREGGHATDVYLGFQMSPRIRILRDELITGKEAARGNHTL